MSGSVDEPVPDELPVGVSDWQFRDYAVRLDVRSSGWTVVTSETAAAERWLIRNYDSSAVRIGNRIAPALLRALKEEGRRADYLIEGTRLTAVR
jgi:hypothetical protein